CDNWFSPTRRETEARIAAIYDRTKGENRFYCSEECKQSCSIFGQQMYPKGFIPEHYKRSSQKEWSEMVKERDNYTCIKCGRKDLPLVAHHIEGLNVNPIESADIDLGITFCSECDKLVHSEIGCRPIDLRRDSLCP
ncbi:MAG: hypothetical protein KKB31_01195, partial [Nanoarchaeota archaeon]|nr:hypothetical protein [Nanoarchaeota archaeon]